MSTENEKYDHLYKVLIIGDSGVGKSSLLLRFTNNEFKDNQLSTIGVDFLFKNVICNGSIVKLQIWDTAGQERYRTITNTYYRGSHGVIIVFDLTNYESFDHLKFWLQQVFYMTNTLSVIIVGNKSDMVSEREVVYSEIEIFCKEYGITYIESSAKNNYNVEKIFTKIALEINNRIQLKFQGINDKNDDNLSNSIILTERDETDSGCFSGIYGSIVEYSKPIINFTQEKYQSWRNKRELINEQSPIKSPLRTEEILSKTKMAQLDL